MNARRLVAPLVALAVLIAAYRYYGWGGVAFVATALVMFLLMHLNRMLQVLRRTANSPKGHVGSAVMLNAKLKPGVNLLHVMALTRSIGEALTPEGQDPEVFRWTDGTQSSVTCEFVNGKLAKWTLHRPEGAEAAEGGPPTAAP